jgi:hypothetical protein
MAASKQEDNFCKLPQQERQDPKSFQDYRTIFVLSLSFFFTFFESKVKGD